MKLLIAVDLSESTEKIVKKAEEIASRLSAGVWLLHVVHPEPADFYIGGRKPESDGFEMDPRGLVYQYRGEFHRKFDPSWNLPGLEVKAEITTEGYRVEGAFILADLVDLGCLADGKMITGLYRGEFSHLGDSSVAQDWISWVDPETPTPDFHVADSFGLFILED